MALILMRHAEAEAGQDDHNRRLTPRGKIDVSIMAAVLAATGWKIGSILCSPLVRTQETRDLLAEKLGDPGNLYPSCLIEVDQRLQPGFSAKDAEELLLASKGSHSSVWIFHAPDISHLAAYFTGMPPENYYFTPGSMLALNIQANKQHNHNTGIQIWHSQPEYMRRVFEKSDT